MITVIISLAIFQFLLSCYVLGVATFHIVKLKNRVTDLENEIKSLKQ